ncbi:sensor histidine kinase [Anaerocolumna sp. MB42-C2]|uniref:sensor histidine kinase n=1 Tax=Anaerocolumna sp. MB42-C2 TaxID=3070997 RepID=UPI0027DECD9C|nr:histidine kinase [Anaerocolumna sp. MB42-C2]WMJ89981.1 histidine kinase [Anaerocolumna sp. MB42-C2]
MKKKSFTLTAKIFLILIIFAVIPMDLILIFMKSRFENYIISELNARTAQTLTKSEEDLHETFDRLSNLSSIIVSSELLKNELQSKDSYFKKYKVFDDVVYQIMLNSVFDANKVQITIIDNNQDIYSNWEKNYHDYTFLLDKEFVKQSHDNKGYVQWAAFSDAFILEDKETDKYIGLSRSILNETVVGNEIGTLIISIRQDQISKVLEKYANPGDNIYVCDEDGQIILRLDQGNGILPEAASTMPKEYYQDVVEDKVKLINGSDYLLCNYNIDAKWTMNGKELKVCYFSDYQDVMKQFRAFTKQMNILVMAALIILIIVIYFIAIMIVKPIKLLAHHMNQYDMNIDTSYKELNVKRNDEIGHLNRSFYNMNENIKELFKQIKVEQKVKEQYRIEFLKAQLNPHFLFNTLGTIRWMAIIKKADNIVEMIDALGNMLRYSMGKGEDLVSIEEEIENLKGYIKIQNMRYGNLCETKILVPDNLLQYKIIRFMLQPIVENAIVHGFGKNKKDNILAIKADTIGDYLQIIIEDNGKGLTDEQMVHINQENCENSLEDNQLEYKKFNKIGIHNVNEQIKIRFGNTYGLHFERANDSGTSVIIKLPLIKEDDENYEERNDC